ncbi:MAG: radical SAM protein [Deltaproteobacteria bacterium]|nr:radical SAM protein [Deltaproteobacteria bacterium]
MTIESVKCQLKKQGFPPGRCLVKTGAKRRTACQVTLKYEDGVPYRLITSVHLSRPENYLSIYQSGCNFSCRKCHSWYLSKVREGTWHSPEDILQKCAEYEDLVNLKEPRDRATAWHAQETCRCCGSCITYGRRSSSCPGVLEPDSVLLSPQGFGPARNIVALTGGDLICCPDFYAECSRLIKEKTGLWVLIETNGYGLTPRNLDLLRDSGVDAFWLDIKAHDPKKHEWLTGCTNDHILRLPEEILMRGFTLEVLSLYIPGLVESDELERIAKELALLDSTLPFTILAFFPEHKMKDFRPPSVTEMVEAYRKAKTTGMENIRLGNLGGFLRSESDREYLMAKVDMDGI